MQFVDFKEVQNTEGRQCRWDAVKQDSGRHSSVLVYPELEINQLGFSGVPDGSEPNLTY